MGFRSSRTTTLIETLSGIPLTSMGEEISVTEINTGGVESERFAAFAGVNTKTLRETASN